MAENEMRYRTIFDSDENGNLLQLSDATIHTEDGCKFDIHRIVLAKNNSYFKAMFCGFGKDKITFLIPGISGKCLSEILIYIYTDELTLTAKNVADLLIAADYLMMKDFLWKIKKYLEKITLENSLPVLLSASKLNFTNMYKAYFRFVQTHCDEVLLHHKALLSEIPIQLLKNLLSNRSLYNVSEAILWDVIVEWVQKDESRNSYVPILIQYLATSEINEHMAKNILNNTIIKHNPHCEDLNSYKSNNCFQNDHDILLHYLQSTNHLVSRFEFRIPPRLYAVLISDGRVTGIVEGMYSEMYVTYDEQLDLVRKVKEVSFNLPHKIISFRNKIYIFAAHFPKFFLLDLNDKSLVEIENMRVTGYFSAFKINRMFYFHGYYERQCNFKTIIVYDPQTDSWKTDIPSLNGEDEEATALFNKIYVVARMKYPRRMVAAVYDTENIVNPWSNLPPPNIFPSFTHSDFVAYNGKLFLIGEDNGVRRVEIFSPDIGKWIKGPRIPKVCDCLTKAVVLNGCLYIHGYDNQDNIKGYTFKWDESEENWHKISEPFDFERCLFCELDEEESVKSLWKDNFSNSNLHKLKLITE